MTKGTCYAPDCARGAEHVGLCGPHYRQKRLGQPFKPVSVRNEPPEVRFWAKVKKTDTCWEWTAAKQPTGYGTFGVNGVMKLSHRVAWEWIKGPIPEGALLDHKCHNRGCVNPDHLRLATYKQNGEHRRGANSNNRSSGVRGVHKDRNTWRAVVKHHGERVYLGNYSTIAEAEAAVVAGRARLFDF